MLGELTLALGGALFVGGVVALALFASRRRQLADADLVAAVDRCFTEIARRRGLALERHAPLRHPVLGEIPLAPRVRGFARGFAVLLSIEGDAAGDGDEKTVLRLSAPAGASDWPKVADPRRRSDAVPAAARAAMERLCARSSRVELDPRTLIVEPDTERRVDWIGRQRRIETDPDRLDAWIGLALELTESL